MKPTLPLSLTEAEAWPLRLAGEADVPALEALIPLSVRTLQAPYHSQAQMDAALGPIFGVDRQLIRDGTYFVAERDGTIVGCGGWSRRRSLYGGDAGRAGEDALLDPERDAARIRVFRSSRMGATWHRAQHHGRLRTGHCRSAFPHSGYCGDAGGRTALRIVRLCSRRALRNSLGGWLEFASGSDDEAVGARVTVCLQPPNDQQQPNNNTNNERLIRHSALGQNL